MTGFGFLREELDSLKQRLAIKQTYAAVFNTVEGHKVLHDLLRRGNVFGLSHDDSPTETAYREGRKAIVLEILSMLRMDNETAMLKLLEEKHDNRSESITAE